jgi:hypothetical protein
VAGQLPHLLAGADVPQPHGPVGAASGQQPSPAAHTFENLLVLDVKTATASQPAPAQTPEPPFVIVIALPTSLRNDFAAGQPGAPLLIWRKAR